MIAKASSSLLNFLLLWRSDVGGVETAAVRKVWCFSGIFSQHGWRVWQAVVTWLSQQPNPSVSSSLPSSFCDRTLPPCWLTANVNPFLQTQLLSPNEIVLQRKNNLFLKTKTCKKNHLYYFCLASLVVHLMRLPLSWLGEVSPSTRQCHGSTLGLGS